MKIIHHPKFLEELSREIEIEKLNLEISQEILYRKRKSIENLARRIYAISFLMFGIGFAAGLVIVTVFNSWA